MSWPKWAADELNAKVSLENPRKSYMWKYFDKFPVAESPVVDVHLSACMFGAAYQKPTTLRCWNWNPSKLNQVCSLAEGVFSCGRSKTEGHTVLEFGQGRTADAAEYTQGLCEKWALAILEATSADVARQISLDMVEFFVRP